MGKGRIIARGIPPGKECCGQGGRQPLASEGCGRLNGAVLKNYVPTPVRRDLSRISDAARQQFALDCAARSGRVSVTGPAKVRLVEGHEIARTFIDRGFFVLGRVTGALEGDLAWFLPFPLAAGLAGSMLLETPVAVAGWCVAGTLPSAPAAAVQEACAMLGPAFSATLSAEAGGDVGVGVQPAQSVNLARSKADFDDVFRWRPFIAVESAFAAPESGPSALLEIWTPDLLRRLGSRLGCGEPIAALEGVVVCVADKAAIQQEVAALLEGQPIGLVSVADLADAFGAVVRYQATAILLDAGHDVHDAIARCARFHSDPRTARIPVLLLASHGRREDVIEAIRAGARDWLVRPFDGATAVQRIARQAIPRS